MALHPEHLDDLERRGDSLLDEERFNRSSWLVRPNVTGEPARLLIAVETGWTPTADEAAMFANAILSECEILQRGDEIR